MYARGIQVKAEGSQGRGDDTALNAIRLYCSAQDGSEYDGVNSK